jgi:hypothetical protein
VRAKRPAPKKKAAAPRGTGMVGVSTRVATRQTTPKQVVQRTQKAGRPAPRGPRMPPGFDPELAAIIDEATKSAPRPKQPQREISTAGPDLSRLALLNNNTNTSWMGGLVQNIARGGLNVATGLPGAAQLVGENAAAFNPVVGPLRFVPGLDAVDRYQNRVAGIDKRAAESQVDWAKYSFGPLAEGDLRTFGSRVYDDPVGILSTFAAGTGAVARAGNVGARIGRAAAPQSQFAARTSRRLSDLPAKERQAIIMQENARRREIGKQPLPFEPGHGGRHRKPREVRSTVGVNEPGVPVAGEIVRQVPRKGYSYNPMTRSVQRGMDARREKTRPKREARADKARNIGEDAGAYATLRSIGVAPRTAEAKAGRALKRETLDTADRWDSRHEVDVNRKANGLARSLRRLKKDKTEAGIPGKERISVEEMAVTLHWEDMASSRGGLSAEQIRAQAVRRMEGGIQERIGKEARQLARKNGISYRQARAAIERSPWVAESRAQVETVKRVPDRLLRLDGDSPDVVRVRDAVTEGRRVNEENQRQSVAAEVVKPETAEAMRSRTSGLLLGGQKWWQDEVAAIQRRTNPKIQGIRKAAARARADGDHVKARKLEAQLKRQVAARSARIARAKRSATRETPELRKAREEFAEAEAKLREVSTPRNGKAPVTDGLSVRLYRSGWAVVKGDSTHMRSVPEDRVLWYGKGKTKKDALVAAEKLRNGAAKTAEKAEPLRASEISAATRARDTYKKRLDKIERESLGFTKARRPELVGDSGVYTPDRLPAPLRPKGKQTGSRASRIGPDEARRSKGYLKTSAGFDMHPALMLHQTARASANYTGRISKQATKELIDTIAYAVPGKLNKNGDPVWLHGDSKLLDKITDKNKVAFISRAKLEQAMRQLDELPEGKVMSKEDVRDIFADWEHGYGKSDYIAVHADSKAVWTEAMTNPSGFLKWYDTGMTYWKGGLLALTPKWYLNNTFGLALQYGVMTGGDLSAIFRGNSRVVREAIEKRAPWVAKDTLADETRGSVKVIKPIRKGFEINAKLEEFWRRAAYANRAKRVLGNEGVRYSRLNSAEFARALETMPDSAVRSIARDIDFFIGNYRKFNKYEQQYFRRISPFYSWLRVISRLTFGMPFRSPTRLFLMNVLANASAAGLDPERYNLPWYERSAFVIGDTRIGVNAGNPGSTLGGLMTAAGAESPVRAALKEGQGWITPAVTAPFSFTHGMNNFGNVINPSPGTAPYGGDKQFINTVTGVSDSQSAGIPASEAFISNLVPGQVAMVRKVASGGWTPRDDATTIDLVKDFYKRLEGGKRNYALYYEKNPDSPLKAFPWNPYVSAVTGANVRRLDREKLAQKNRKDNQRIREQNRSLDKAKRRAQRP